MTQRPPIESVDRAVRVLKALASAGPSGVTLVELAGQVELNKATTHRMLAALKYRDFAAQDLQSGRYLLGGAAGELGAVFFNNENLAAMVHPALLALSSNISELIHLGMLNGAKIVYLDKVEPDRAVRVFSAIGSAVPAVSTAMGRALLAARGIQEQELAPYMEAVAAGTRPAALKVEDVWRQLEFARSNGYAREDQENEEGISCIAVPLFRGTRPIAAVSITAPAERMTTQRMAELYGTILADLGPMLPPGLSLE